jgi:saccharopine dehydrogenase-like NADP-dependent oxidoreductase
MFNPLILDIDYDRVRALKDAGIPAEHISGGEADCLDFYIQGAAAVVCAAPPSVVPVVARVAALRGCPYVDLCEDPKALSQVARVASGAESSFISGCGIAPGLIALMVKKLAENSPNEAEITVYVGVLPLQKSNRLGYGNMWDIQALLSEYTNPCLGLVAGELVKQPPLTGYEILTIAGQEFEAFTTSGALDAVAPHYKGRLNCLNFKTLRYPGHLDYISFLLEDLGLSNRLYLMRNLLMTGLERTKSDNVIIHLVCRYQGEEKAFTKVFKGQAGGKEAPMSALAHISASHVCSVLDLLTKGKLRETGMLSSSDIPFDDISQSVFFDAFRGSLARF